MHSHDVSSMQYSVTMTLAQWGFYTQKAYKKERKKERMSITLSSVMCNTKLCVTISENVVLCFITLL